MQFSHESELLLRRQEATAAASQQVVPPPSARDSQCNCLLLGITRGRDLDDIEAKAVEDVPLCGVEQPEHQAVRSLRVAFFSQDIYSLKLWKTGNGSALVSQD